MSKKTVYTHAFDFIYKWCPDGAGEIKDLWPFQSRTDDYNTEPLTMMRGYYNNALSSNDLMPILTRGTPPFSSSAGAIPWGCIATDLLWNCLTPTQSGVAFSSVARGGGTFNNTTTFTFTYNSASFYYSNGFLGLPDGIGVIKYPVTSSWKAVEPLMTHSNMEYKISTSGTNNIATEPATIIKPAQIYIQPSAISNTIPGYAEPSSQFDPLPNGTNPGMITFGNTSTGSFDGRFYDLAGGIGISRQDVSASLAGYASQSHLQSSAVNKNLSNELKQRRLFFPTIAATSSGNPLSAPYTGVEWLGFLDPGDLTRDTNNIFNTNGAIFNVKFNLKRDTKIDMFPDPGPGSQLLVYIFNVKPNVGPIAARVAGIAGFYPPDNNIIRIKNDPAMSFVNPATGFLIESFNINVVQYGTNAQLVFEASGSLESDTYFGCIIDDVEFCQVGVSTDPALLKPETVGDAIQTSINEGLSDS
mgnify:FL=1